MNSLGYILDAVKVLMCLSNERNEEMNLTR